MGSTEGLGANLGFCFHWCKEWAPRVSLAHSSLVNSKQKSMNLKCGKTGDFPGGPVAKTALPMQGAWVRSLIRELDSTGHN